MFLPALDELSFPCCAGLDAQQIIRPSFVREAKEALDCLACAWTLAGSVCPTVTAVLLSGRDQTLGQLRAPTSLMWRNRWIFWCDIFNMSFFTGRHTKMLWVNSDLGRALAPTVEWCRYWCINSSVLLRWCVAMNSCWGTEDKLWLLILTSLRVYWAGQAVPEEGKSKDDLWGRVKGNPCLREMHGAQSTYPRRQLAGSVSKCLNKEE